MSETVVFFGSGPVAAQSLERLAEQFSIEAVITKPKPAHHRGDFPVIAMAEKLELPTATASNKQELSKLMAATSYSSRIAVLIDFGIIVSQDVIDYFPLGIVNSHFSLLPEWRGADPISFAILSGQDKTGVSLMLIDQGMDTGKIIAQRSHVIKSDTTTPQLTLELIELSNMMLGEYLPKYAQGTLSPRSQPHPDRATYSRKLTKDDGIIDWSKPATEIEQEIRAYYDWPKSRTVLFDKEIIITKAHAVPNQGPTTRPGDAEILQDAGIIVVTTGDGLLRIEQLKPAGKKEMNARAFINGYLTAQ